MNGITQFRLLVINNILRNDKTNSQKWKHIIQENASLQGLAKFAEERIVVRTGLVKVIRRMVFIFYFIYLTLVYWRKHSQSLYLIPQVSHFPLSCSYLNLILWVPSVRLLTRFENDLALNPALLSNYYL